MGEQLSETVYQSAGQQTCQPADCRPTDHVYCHGAKSPAQKDSQDHGCLSDDTCFYAYAREESSEELSRYYTSIQIRPGDNLWKIAERYAEGAGYTAAEYVEELKRMNRLQDGQVHSGEYLTIVYLAE